MVMRCLLVCEGNSDAPLVSHIQRLLDVYGFQSSDFDSSTDGRRLIDKMRNGLRQAERYDLLFVHRDADRAGADARHREIAQAIQQSGYHGPYVGIVPVRMTEAWLLLHAGEIRTAARNPRGRIPLNLPSPDAAARIANPKSALETALLDASELQGRHRDRLRRTLPEMRNHLLENLPIGGPLEQLESWTRFRDDTISALQQLNR